MAACFPCRLLDCFGASARAAPSPPPPVAAPSCTRRRVQGLSTVARASRRSPAEEVRAVFEDISKSERVGQADLIDFFCGYLGYGQPEAKSFMRRYGQENWLAFPGFKDGYPRLNPFLVTGCTGEVFIRKPGSLSRQQVNLEELCDCEVYICDPPGQVFVDACARCLVLIGPCDGPVSIRNCEGCTVWVAAQQVRLKSCSSCTFHIFSKTPPAMVNCEDIRVAPWCASYPGCREHFAALSFDAGKNFWNCILDFSGAPCKQVQICSLEEVAQLNLHLAEEDAAAGNPCPVPTHEMLSSPPLTEGVDLEENPLVALCAPRPPLCPLLVLNVTEKDDRVIGAGFLNAARSLAQQKLVLHLIARAHGSSRR